jgi:hypothetical protein
MTGKSRLIKEMAQHVFSIHMCLRDKEETGYPAERFLQFFESLPVTQKGRIEQFILSFTFMVEELTDLLRKKNSASPSDFWKYQEENSIYSADEYAQ